MAKTKSKLKKLTLALESGELDQVRRILNKGLAPADIAHLIESSLPKERQVIWSLVKPKMEGEVLQYISDDIQGQLIREMSPERLADVTADLDTDDVVDILQQLPDMVIDEVLQAMDEQDRNRLEAVIGYPEDSAGGLMNTDTITIRADITLDVVMRYLRLHKELPEMTDRLLVVSRKNEFIGSLPVNKLLVNDPQQTVREIMDTDIITIDADQHEDEVANLFERHDLISAPVVDSNGLLLGRITIDDVVDVIRDSADHSLMSMAGLDEDADTFAPVIKTSKSRAVWLGINLLTAFAASAVIGLFDATIQQVVALAILMPIVASMGGIAGSQVLTLVIRGQAVGHLSNDKFAWLLNREIRVALINGVLWAGVIAGITLVWFSDSKIALIIAAAIMINLMIAAIAGTILPLILKKLNIDPALAGGVILTTITDVIGFLSFLGLASLFYL